MHTRVLRPTAPIQLEITLAPLRRGRADPTIRFSPDGVWRASRTPQGPATTRLTQRGTEIEVEAWGAGAGWALENAPQVIGLHDDPSSFAPAHPFVRAQHRRFPGLRMSRSNVVVEALVPTIIEQKVQSAAARTSYRQLVLAYGEPAPGPGPLRLPPAPETLAALPYWAFHPFGIEKKRADTIRRVCALASRVEEAITMSSDEARRRLTLVPGIGPWSAAEVARVALGDADAISVGDFHLPHLVAWALAGEARADDDRMLELVAPYEGQRGRVQRLIEVSSLRAPMFGPRTRLRAIARI